VTLVIRPPLNETETCTIPCVTTTTGPAALVVLLAAVESAEALVAALACSIPIIASSVATLATTVRR